MKKNILKIPEKILLKVKKIQTDEIVVTVAKLLSISDIKDGKYISLGIGFTDKLIYEKETLPDIKSGKFSYWNINGREIKRIDLPKERHYRYIEAPNWGDSYKGTHTVAIPYEGYPIELISPRFLKIKTELLNANTTNTNFLFRFTLSEVLNKKDKDFKAKLFDCLNILQENLSDFDVEKSDITTQEFLATHHISWEILPPGNKDEFISRLFFGRNYTNQQKEVAESRYDFFMSLRPENIIIGASGFQRYFGAKLNNNIVLFENTDYGNAIYIMYDNWEELSKRSRIELLSGRFGTNFDRVIHTGDWKKKVRFIIRRRYGNRK